MRNDRATVLWVLKILKEYSDEEHIVGMSELISLIYNEFGQTLDGRTVNASIKTLIDFGYDISTYAENKKVYYLRERHFETAEIKLLMDAVYSFHGIPAAQTTDIISRLQHFLSKHKRRYYHNLITVKPIHKTRNKEVFLNIELIDEAISKGKQVSFIYNRYDFDKTMKPRNKRPFIVDPYLLLSENENYYLICKHNYFNKTSYFRIDRMTDINILDEYAKPVIKDVSFENYVKKASAVYFGKEELFKFRCKKTILDDVFDTFGTEIEIYNITDDTFDFSLKMVDKAATFFSLKYISRCEILSPEHARERMRRYIQSGVERYFK